jgi:hypothetical protein
MKQKHPKSKVIAKDHGKNLFDAIIFMLLFTLLLWYFKV